MTAILVLLVCIVMLEFSNATVFGRMLSNDKVLEYLEKYSPFELNPMTSAIISPKMDFNSGEDFSKLMDILRNGEFISTVPLSVLSKYYINGYGRVLRWSQAHYKIKELHKKLKKDK